MADKFKREMIALGVGQVVGDLYASLHAITALAIEGIDSHEWELIRHELTKRGLSPQDVKNAAEDFVSCFVEHI